MGHHDHRLPVLVDGPADLGEQFGRGPGVEVAGRLVREDQVRPRDQGPRRRHPLLLPAGQLGRPVPEPVGDAQRAGQFGQPRLVGLLAAECQREGHVLPRGQRGHQVESLEHEADALTAQQRHGLVVQLAELDVAEQHLSRGEPVQARQAVQQRRLARAGRAHDRGERARGELRGDRVERPDRRRARAVDLYSLDDACRGRRPERARALPVDRGCLHGPSAAYGLLHGQHAGKAMRSGQGRTSGTRQTSFPDAESAGSVRDDVVNEPP